MFLILGIITALFLFLYIILKPIIPFFPHLNYFLGLSSPRTYLVLLQNNTELRANGGFAGSYAKILLTPKQCSSFICLPDLNLSVSDIYVPNGQLVGYVEPPLPIQQAFQHGTWELANADWDPDFPTAANSLRWFFDKGGEINPDVLATLNLNTVKQSLQIIGPLSLPDYQAEINADNFYQFLQSQIETDFFPGSTKKSDLLTTTIKSLKNKFTHLNIFQYAKILNLVARELNRQNILLNSRDIDIQTFLEKRHFAGALLPGNLDTYLLVETNLGANKANCCTVTTTNHTITQNDSDYTHTVNLQIENRSPSANPNPPLYFGGHYLAYLRFYIPATAHSIDITSLPSSPAGELNLFFDDQIHYQTSHNLLEIGFYHPTAAGTTSSINLTYHTATGSAQTPYSLKLLKQNGVPASQTTLNYQGYTLSTDLSSGLTFPQ